MNAKKLLAALLVLTMLLSFPLAVSAADWTTLECPGWWQNHSSPAMITESIQSWTFTNTSYETADSNWHTPSVVIYSGDYVGAPNFLEEGVMRSDLYGWGTTGSLTVHSAVAPADWAAWVAANKAGVTCTVTAQLVGDYIVVGFNNGGVTSVFYLDNDAPEGAAVNLGMTGEQCTISGWTETSEHVDISACVSYLAGETEWSVVNTTLGAAKSQALPLSTEIQSWKFISTTNADAVNNWDSAAIDVSSDAAWEMTVRSDSFTVSEENGWGTAGEDAFGGKAYPADWAAWLAENHAGAECIVTAQLVEGDGANYIVVAFSNAGVANTYIVPTNGSLDSVNLFLTGENCVLTKLEQTDAHLDIAAAVASVTPAEPEETLPEETEPEETEPEETEPEETEPEVTEPEETVPEETVPEETEPEGWVVDCPAWWGGHSPAVVVTEEIQSWSFTNTTYETAADNWDTATVVVWRSDDGTMSGSNYLEELLIRSDSYAVSEEAFWGTNGQPTYATKNYPADWAEWLAGNKAGAECTVTAQIVSGYIVVGLTNNGVTNVYSVPMNSSLSSPVYLSLTGEECTLSNWASTTEHIDISAAVAAPDAGNPVTGDLLPFIAIAVCLLSFAAIVILNKKRLAI